MSFQTGDIVRLKDGNPLDSVVARVERVGARQTRVEFIRLPWTPPDYALPELRDFPHDQLIKCRDPWSDAATGRWSSPEASRLKVRAAELWLSNAEGQLGSARTDLLPHQVCLVHEIVQRKVRRVLIAEEVGMGKTIETGMIIHALQQRREMERCLVVCPAGQILQWQEELEDKLHVRFEVYRHDVDGQRAFSFPMVIASLDTLKLDQPNNRLRGKSHREILLASPAWDMVVFDEAHRLTAKDYGSKTEKTLNYRLAEELCGRTRDFLFLTGTPHDGNDSKFRNLLKALDPEVVFSRQEKGPFFGDMILKNRKSEARDAEGEHLFKKVTVNKLWLDPLPDGELEFHGKLTSYLREGYGVAGQDPLNPRSRALGFVMTTFQKLASSSVAAVRGALAKRLNLLEENFTKKNGTTVEEDSRFEGEIEEAEAEETQSAQLREAFTHVEISMLRELVDFKVPREAKWRELCKLVQDVSASDSTEKFLIFTEYRGTVAFLKGALENKHGPGSVVVIMGGMGADARKDSIQQFREESACRYLLSTEAGGEGINLQFCNIVVNYDSPWNPFRVVQRIGRVHRIGQKRNMQVFTFRLRNGLDQRLTECHEDRVDTAVARLAEVTGLDAADIRDQLLGLAQEFIDYEKLYRQAIKDSETKSSEAEIAQGIFKAEQAFQLAYETIFKHAVAPFNPERFKKLVRQILTLDDLHHWLDDYLKTQGRRLLHREAENLYEFLVPEGLKHHLPAERRTAKGTFDRKRAIREQATPLFAFGQPMIDLLFRAALAPDSDGGAVFAPPPKSSKSSIANVIVLVRHEEHAGTSAYRLVNVECRKDLSCSLTTEIATPEVKPLPVILPNQGTTQIKQAVTDFLAQQFPEIDFIGDKLFWLSLCLFQVDESPEIVAPAASFPGEAREWIKRQLGEGEWEKIATEIASRLSPVGSAIELADVGEIAQALNAKPQDVHAVLTALTSRPDSFIVRQFYRFTDGQRVEVPPEEVGRHLDLREQAPIKWRTWAETVGVAWKKTK